MAHFPRSVKALISIRAGGIETGALTLQPCIDHVDEWISVTEAEIASAVVGMLRHHSKLIEGAAGCSVAALIKKRGQGRGRSTAGGSQGPLEAQTGGSSAAARGGSSVVICCGGNMSLSSLRQLLLDHPHEE